MFMVLMSETQKSTNEIEKLSCYTDKILQLIAQWNNSFLKDTTDFINFIEKQSFPKIVIPVLMDIMSLF